MTRGRLVGAATGRATTALLNSESCMALLFVPKGCSRKIQDEKASAEALNAVAKRTMHGIVERKAL